MPEVASEADTLFCRVFSKQPLCRRSSRCNKEVKASARAYFHRLAPDVIPRQVEGPPFQTYALTTKTTKPVGMMHHPTVHKSGVDEQIPSRKLSLTTSAILVVHLIAVKGSLSRCRWPRMKAQSWGVTKRV